MTLKKARLYSLAAALALGTLITGAGSAAASGADRPAAKAVTCPGWKVTLPPDPGLELASLDDVAVLSASNVWAVGYYNNDNNVFDTLVVHWNGKKWSRVASPNPGVGANYLSSVVAVSASNIWAVGTYSTEANDSVGNSTLVEHWNGKKWSQVASPDPGSFANDLITVRKVTVNDIWAVGYYAGSNVEDRTLVLRWNGKTWTRLPSPDQGALSDVMSGVAGRSADSVWVTESYRTSPGSDGAGVILHWNGKAWSTQESLSGDDIDALSFSSATNGWATGGDGAGRSLALHWNGRKWARVSTPSVKDLTNTLGSVTVLSPTNAWAVGSAGSVVNSFDSASLAEHWNGKSWSMMKDPGPVGTSGLSGVDATPTTSPWAVGEYGLSNRTLRTLAFSCT
jgi:hypothetical protein